MAKAFVFPGQGSQFVGMGNGLAGAFAEARSVFEEVDEALHQKLSALMFDGSEAELTLTANAQPALMATSLAALRVLEGELGVDLARDAAFVAGHSLGEYSALAAAGSLTVADAARLLRLRGEAMQRAVPVGEGMMAALIGLDYAAGAAIAAEAQEQAQAICAVANDNGGGQIVISGAKPAVECAIELAKTKGVRRAIPLSVSAPFHCALMAPAAKRMAEALAKIDIKKPKVPVVANVLAAPVEDPREIRERLVEQVTGTVRWRESVVFMAGRGVSEFIELGSGKVLTGLLKRIVETATGIAVGTPDEIKAYQAFC
ncbi:MAG: ACP S-malonyltransferase [Methylovirgula sp.]